ncbi:MAG: UvrB/UvrC motif-containing protein [Verrucomicrobia bacterium]|jgi:tetratricopeptide (TPR) repeat protein|nr:UvrB/UvrC motif-containing protein [Verrucomicrobiota bacterium]
MKFDISSLLADWEYRPGQIDVRRFVGKDKIEKIQLRIDLGVLQMNAEGRPDGKQPYGHESLLEHYESRLADHISKHGGSDEEFALNAEDCARIFHESIQYHHRYICLFQLKDFDDVLRDTERNLEVFEFVEEYAESDELSFSMQQFRPQLLMIQTRARASIALEEGDYVQAMELTREGIEEIRDFFREHDRFEMAEQSGEIKSLEQWLEELNDERPLTKKEALEKALSDALQREDYEKAAHVRDTLKSLKESS